MDNSAQPSQTAPVSETPASAAAPAAAPVTTDPATAPTSTSMPAPAAASAASSTPPSQPPTPTKHGLNPFLILGIVVLVALVGAAAYFLGKGQIPVKQVVYTPTPTIPVEVSPTEVASPTAMTTQTGSVSGTLCYPGSIIPAGTIYAKDLATAKETTQAYPGTQNGGGTSYTMSLTAGTYHMKFVPTQYSTVIGYYTEYSTCVNNPSEPNCTGQKTRAILPVTITAGQTTSKVNLCDYYYPTGAPPAY